jgi:hypothetical protein
MRTYVCVRCARNLHRALLKANALAARTNGHTAAKRRNFDLTPGNGARGIVHS